MSMELNLPAYQKLIDEDLDWLAQQPRTLERDHVAQCMQWLRENKPQTQSLFLMLYDDSIGDWFFHGVFSDDANGRETIARIVVNGVGYQVVRGIRTQRYMPRDEEDDIEWDNRDDEDVGDSK